MSSRPVSCAIDFVKSNSHLRIGLVDADLIDHGTRHPNLVLLKLSGYFKARGHSVELIEAFEAVPDYDIVFISCVFTFTNIPEGLLALPNVVYGGTGFYEDGGENLPDEVEHFHPDYSLYQSFVEKQLASGRRRSQYADYLDYSIGFTTRGCFRKCSFCVNQKYDHAFKHSPVSEFLDEDRPYIYLWDDNFFAFPGWREILDELRETGKPFQFRQGLDVRLMTDAKAKALSGCRYHGDYIFAFDHIEDRELIERKLRIWRTWSDKGTRLYVLSGYDSQDARDIANVFERISILMKYGCLPYIMRYEKYKESPLRGLYVTIARWCNQPQFFKKKSFREFCEANQALHKTKGTLCSAYAAMTSFEQEYPEIAKRYFDLKFEERNMLRWYGRQFIGAPSKDVDDIQRNAWARFATGESSTEEVLAAYYAKNLDIVWLASAGEMSSGEGLSKELFSLLREASLRQVFHAVCSLQPCELITAANIPQFSNLEALDAAVRILTLIGEPLTFEKLGIYLTGDRGKKATANIKFGENHGKLATLLDLADVKGERRGIEIVASPFSDLYCALPDDEKQNMLAKLCFRIPVIRELLCDAAKADDGEPVYIEDYLRPLSDSTKKRRAPNVAGLLRLIDGQCGTEDRALSVAISRIGRR